MANHSAEVGGCNLYTPWLTFPTHPPPPQTSICKTLTAAKKKLVHQQHLTQQNPVLIKIYPKKWFTISKKINKIQVFIFKKNQNPGFHLQNHQNPAPSSTGISPFNISRSQLPTTQTIPPPTVRLAIWT